MKTPRPFVLGAAALTLSLLASTEARADAPERLWGLGTALGPGFAGSVLGSTTNAVSFAFLLPSFEARIFLPRRPWSIDLTVPLASSVLTSVLLGGFFINSDVFLNFNVGDRYRLLVGPGLGFGLGVSARYSASAAGSLRIPAELGFEVLTPGRTFGFQLLARPWFELGILPGSGGSLAASPGGGVLFLLGFVGYRVSP